MTAQQLVDLTKPVLSNISVKNDDTILLGFLNLAKNQIALDTRLWLDGEEITMTSSSTYTLDTLPIQIIDVYDSNLTVRPRNSSTYYGYYQTSPNTIKVNNPSADTKLYVNYYYTPDDYELSDNVIVPQSLLNAIQYFVIHKAYETLTGQAEMVGSGEYYKRYQKAISMYLSKVDENTDTLMDNDMITAKGLV